MKCVGEAKKRGEEVACVQCGKPFHRHPSQPDHRFCSKSCAITARNLTEANPSYHRDISGANNPMYGKGRFGADNPMFGRRNPHWWKGGRKVRKDGYALVWIDGSYVLEHRHIVEQRIGRKLRPEEVVHHIDENPSNNASDNLELLPNQAEHQKRHLRRRPI
jgi:hypothetical protein